MSATADVEALLEQFMELSWSEPCTLEEYVARLVRGVYGDVNPREIRDLIDRVERITLANIETKADEGAHWDGRANDVAEAAMERFAALRARHAPKEPNE